jgi:hypothetical protein
MTSTKNTNDGTVTKRVVVTDSNSNQPYHKTYHNNNDVISDTTSWETVHTRRSHGCHLSQQHMACLKSALALVVLKRRYQEQQQERRHDENNDFRHYKKRITTGSGGGVRMDSGKMPEPEMKSKMTTNKTTHDKLPSIISSCWYDRLHHLMQLALHTHIQLDHEEDKNQTEASESHRQQGYHRYLSERFNGLVTHLACQFEQLLCHVGSTEYVEHIVASFKEPKDMELSPLDRTSGSTMEADQDVNAVPQVADCKKSDDGNKKDQESKNVDERTNSPSIITLYQFFLDHLVLPPHNQNMTTTRTTNGDDCEYKVDPLVGKLVPFFFIWRRLIKIKPLTMTILLVPVLLKLIIPHTIQYQFIHSSSKNRSGCSSINQMAEMTTYYDIDCCYYWYKLLQATSVMMRCYDEDDDMIRHFMIQQLIKYTVPMTSVSDLAYRYYKGIEMNRRNHTSYLSIDATIGTKLLLEIALSDILQQLMSESRTNQATNNDTTMQEDNYF